MTTTKGDYSRPATVRPDTTNRSVAKVLVSSHPGLRYQSRRSGETIVFDKEIFPGIFIPSVLVPDDLSEEYRNVNGSLGVNVWGTLKREMTRAEIDGLRPDDPKTIDREMRSSKAQISARIGYDVARVPKRPIEPHRLPKDAHAKLRRALSKTPSATFIAGVEEALGIYLLDRELVRNATPKKVQVRIRGVREQIESLCRAIDELETSDSIVIGSAAKRERRKGRLTITGLQIRGLLALYHRHVAEAEEYVMRNSRARGRMPGYADDAFTRNILDLVQRETGKRPTTTRARKKEGRTEDFTEDMGSRGSPLTQVLTILLNSVAPGSFKPRKDVEALARRAVRSPYFVAG